MGTRKNRFWINRLSIQQRLTLLIFTLLFSAIVVYGFANYYSLKKATMIIGKARLSTLTSQISSMLSQSAQFLVKRERDAAGQNSVIQYLQSGGKEYGKETLAGLNKLYRDSTWVLTELVDKNFAPVLRADKSAINTVVDAKEVIPAMRLGTDSGKVGKFYVVKGNTYYPIVAAVGDKAHIAGYIISWLLLPASQKSVDQLSKLMGTGANLYLGNTDGSFWTNTIKPVTGPPFDAKKPHGAIEFTGADGTAMIGWVQPVASADWLTAISFSKQDMLGSVNGFMKWIFIFGALLTVVGVVAVWLMSRNITKPLNLLTIAAKAISKGNYSSPQLIDVQRDDELGELANAFNMMTTEVYHVWQTLDAKVKERTMQLELVNKELEAFSYSVSHDLRTPLRAINGYSIMLKEDYEEKLDAEGKRIIGNVITNARMMGQLIDDLLAFSRLGKKELANTSIDMQALVTGVVNELLQHDLEKDYHINIVALPRADADPGMMKQVFMNLVNNAVKYSSKKDHPEIEIGARDEETRTVYYVKDNGVGFDMAYAGKLFGVFQRLHSQEEFEGTGVGLALVKRIIDKHGGEVWAEGLENIGATFYFSIPKKVNHE